MASSKDATSSNPLLHEFVHDSTHDIRKAYACDDHAKFVQSFDGKTEYVVDYEPLKLSSFRVFCTHRGTILTDPILLIEQLIITCIFVGFAVPVYLHFRSDYEAQNVGADMEKETSVGKWLAHQEPNMRAFAATMTTLAAFLLSFYTAVSVARWWTIRTGGIGGIKAATTELELLIYQQVTQEEEVLSAIRRYGRASLVLVFLWRRKELDQVKEQLTKFGILTEHECDKLNTWNHCLHETIWGWQLGIVSMLHKEGKVRSEYTFRMLLDRISHGRSAAQLIHTHLAVRIPMQYVHLLGLLVKMHNAVLAMTMGALFGAAMRNRETIVMIQLFGRTLILPFLFNAILLIAADLADPFQGKAADFPGTAYEQTLEKDCSSMVKATQHMPKWLAARYHDDVESNSEAW